MSVLSVACPTCLMGEGVECINMFAHPTVHIDPHSSRVALHKYGPEALGVFTGDLSADPDEHIKPLTSLPEAYAPPTPVVPEIPYRPTLPLMDTLDYGTILRWTRTWPDGMAYPYVAIKTEVGWWITEKSAEPMTWSKLCDEHLNFASRVERALDWLVIKEV